MSDDSLLRLDRQLCFALYSASNAVTRAYRPWLDQLDLTYLQYLVMMVLWQEEGISVTGLGSQLHLDSGTLTPLLKRLEAKGLIRRGRSEHDERVRVLLLTDEGRALYEKAATIPAELRCRLSMIDEQLLSLKQACERIVDDLEAQP
ncbi:transcriptional regulator, MarR family [Aeromonas sp. RU39B]|uniref:MarR family winged helix-turn-helix transcriptional regulator n=1 Tax=Aeromonas sp. RU39B TaxID=1907416 RepID=UPI0009541347|nr:MarR family transcriptional regulator [Aeromonas sp. RU39B]SIR21842.1 transcriptional regulator, MarR family [Aeromonas sp. RU39B]